MSLAISVRKEEILGHMFSKRTATQHSVDTTDSLDATKSIADTATFLDVVQTGNNAVWTSLISNK